MGKYLDIAARVAPEETPHCERSETSEERGAGAGDNSHLPLLSHPDPFRRWRVANAGRLAADDARLGHDPGGFCVEHNRWLTWPEQRRGACSWCVPPDPERESEYWASHWRRFGAR